MLPKGFKFTPWRFSKFDSPSDSGSPVKVKYSGRYDDEGRVVLDEVGLEDTYEYIQSFADDCDINHIMEQFTRTGDEELLNRAKGIYVDVSDLPDNWPDVLNIINRGKEEFSKMPPEFKELFGNDFAQFAANFDPRLFDVSEPVAPVVPGNPSAEDVKEGDSNES